MKLFPENINFNDNFGAILAVLSALYFSYLPIIYVTNAFGIAKWLGFISVLALSLFITIVRLARTNFVLSKHIVTAFLLYIPFLLYAANSYAWHINYLNDYQTVVVITLINPIMIVLALMYHNQKEIMLKTILVFSAIYFIFVLRAAIFGNLLTTNDFTQVFSFVSSAEYQNINIYLGFFLILLWIFPIFKNLIWLIFKMGLSLLILMMMFAVGGRASIIAAVVVLFLMLYLSQVSIGGKLAITFVLIGATILVMMHLSQLIPGADILGFRRFEVLWSGDDSSERVFLFTNAWNLFFLNPKNIFFGAGMNAFPIYIGKMTTGWYPHNLILELLSEYGTIGLSLFIIPICYLLHMRKKVLGSVSGRSSVEKGSFYIFLYLLFESMVTGGLFYSWMLIFFTFMVFPGFQAGGSLQREPFFQHQTDKFERNTRLVNT